MTKYKVGDKVKVRIDLVPYEVYGGLTLLNGNMSKCAGQICTIKEITINNRYHVNENLFVWSEEMLEPADVDGGKIAYAPNGAPLFWKPEPEKPVSIEEQLGLPKGVSIHDLPTSEWYNSPSGELIISHTEMERAMDRLSDWATNVQLDKETVFNGLSQVLKRATEVYSSTKEEKNLKFTFYVTEGYRIDKSNNTKIPTVTTEVVYNDKDGYPTSGGLATCDKADYDSRQGVLEALANMCCNGNFDREYNKAVKDDARADKKARTCTYCGQLFDTVEEKQAHEAWHVERKKARRERYLLRKRAKEIAFEEAAQKMAKEMITEGNKK